MRFYFRSHLLQVIALLLTAAMTLMVYWGYTNTLVKEQQEATHELSQSIDDYLLANLHQAIYGVAQFPLVTKVAVGETEIDDPQALNVLEILRLALGAEIVYIMNIHGDVVASTRYDGSKSLTGNNYVFRPYFTQALREGRSTYTALGVTTNKRGLYKGVVINGASGPVGVLVVKSGFEVIDSKLAAFAKTNNMSALLLSSDGVVMSANDPSWLYQLAQVLPEASVQHLQQSRQFEGQTLRALFDAESGNHVTVQDVGFYRSLEKIETGTDGYHFFQLMTLRTEYPWQMFWRFALVFVLLWLLVVGVISILVRNKEKREAAEALLETKQMLLEIAEHSHTVSWQIDATGLYSYVSEASIIVFGYHPEELVGKKYFYDLHPAEGREAFKQSVLALAERRESFQNFENKIQKKSGEVVWVATNALPVIDKTGVLLGYRGSDHDIHDRKQVELALERLAHYDPLTNLPNRVLLAKEMKSAMAQALQSQRRLAIVFIDLDGFKDINDACGHKIGDWVLVELSERMRHVMATKGFVARTGGDEFVAIITSLDVDESCLMVVNELLKVIALPMQHPDIEDALQVSGSIGVTVYPQSESLDAEQLLRQADQAMYQAKLSGKNRCYLFDTAQDSHLRDHHESLERIEYALTHDELVLYYQPKINMRSGEVHGFEALIRWQHPERGLLPPMTFLPEIEGHALEVKVGNWVIDQALTQIETLFATNVVHQVSVNIAAFHLLQPDFVAQLEAHLARHPNVPKYALEMELLETSALEDMGRVSEIIHACAALGVHFALDDFGTGYSSLAYLKRLPAPMLKIDQSFVRDMLSDADDLAIIQGVLGLAKAFHRQVIAEGVESEAHGVQLLAMGCELAQGYAVSKPMPEHEVLPWLTQWKPFSSWQVN